MAAVTTLQRTLQLLSPWTQSWLHGAADRRQLSPAEFQQRRTAPLAAPGRMPRFTTPARHVHFATQLVQRYSSHQRLAAVSQPAAGYRTMSQPLPLVGNEGAPMGAATVAPASQAAPLTWEPVVPQFPFTAPVMPEEGIETAPIAMAAERSTRQLAERIQRTEAAPQFSGVAAVPVATPLIAATPAQQASSTQQVQPNLVARIEERIQRAHDHGEQAVAPVTPTMQLTTAPVPAHSLSRPSSPPSGSAVSLTAIIEARIQRAQQGLPPIASDEPWVTPDTHAPIQPTVPTSQPNVDLSPPTVATAAEEVSGESSLQPQNTPTAGSASRQPVAPMQPAQRTSLTAIIEQRIHQAAGEQPPVQQTAVQARTENPMGAEPKPSFPGGQDHSLPPQIRRLLAYSTVEEMGAKPFKPPTVAPSPVAGSPVQAGPTNPIQLKSEPTAVRPPSQPGAGSLRDESTRLSSPALSVMGGSIIASPTDDAADGFPSVSAGALVGEPVDQRRLLADDGAALVALTQSQANVSEKTEGPAVEPARFLTDAENGNSAPAEVTGEPQHVQRKDIMSEGDFTPGADAPVPDVDNGVPLRSVQVLSPLVPSASPPPSAQAEPLASRLGNSASHAITAKVSSDSTSATAIPTMLAPVYHASPGVLMPVEQQEHGADGPIQRTAFTPEERSLYRAAPALPLAAPLGVTPIPAKTAMSTPEPVESESWNSPLAPTIPALRQTRSLSQGTLAAASIPPSPVSSGEQPLPAIVAGGHRESTAAALPTTIKRAPATDNATRNVSGAKAQTLPQIIPPLPSVDTPSVIGVDAPSVSEQWGKRQAVAPDLDQVARRVLPLIKRMLAVERERFPIL